MDTSEVVSMDHQELHEALVWLRRAVAIGEEALRKGLPDEAREEWSLALEKKRTLLLRLEALNANLTSIPNGKSEAETRHSCSVQ